MSSSLKRSNSGSATVNEKGNVGTGIKRTNSDMQQSNLSFTTKKQAPIPSPTKKPSKFISTTTKPLLAPTRSVELSQGLASPSTLPNDIFSPLGEGKETPEMIMNLEVGLYPGDEGLESDVESEEEDTLITPKKKRVNKDVVIVGEDDEDDNGKTLLSLGPTKIHSKGSKIRDSMIHANEEIERVRKNAHRVAGDVGKSKSKSKGKTAKGEAENLNVKDKKWEKIFWEARKAMGDGDAIHCTPQSHTRVHHILRVFDLTSEYGPCVGISRLQRWERAQEWGLNPPLEIKEILLTLEGAEDDSYRETVFHGTGIYSATA